jgi:two-component system, OmpR family, sensor histidine kinase KdpD
MRHRFQRSLSANRAVRLWGTWLGVLAVATAGMLAVRGRLGEVHIALAYLLVVLGGSSRGGRFIGIGLAVAAFFSFNFFFIPPYHTLAIADPVDWLVLVSFFATSAVAAQLLTVATNEAIAARQRATEIDHLSSLGAETLNAGHAEEALSNIAEIVRSTLGVSRCEIYLRAEDQSSVILAAGSGTEPSSLPQEVTYAGSSLVEWVAAAGRPAIERSNGSVRIGERPAEGVAALELVDLRVLLVPLLVRDRAVGVLRIAHASALTLDGAQQRFVQALSYYAALGVERVRLVAAAERAEALRQADVLKDALLASVSHDLRTPLTTIKALAHDIAEGGDERAITIEEEADRLNRFVVDLLDLSRLSGGALRVAPEINAAEDLLGVALQRVAGSSNGRALNVTLDPADSLLLGRFDFVHSLRVLVNLIENAIKYSPAGSAIDVSVHRAGEHLEFIVADRGPGVADAERQRVFEPFYRPNRDVPDAGGAGLGLSIARQLAEAQGGSVVFEPRDGGGSRFVFRLPAADPSELELTAISPPESL